jgi:hypothetical protein
LQDLTGLDGLKRCGGSVYLYSNAGLRSLHGLEALVEVGDISIREHPLLASVMALGSLTQLGIFDVEDNPRLPTCQVRAVFTTARGQQLYALGNDDAAACP